MSPLAVAIISVVGSLVLSSLIHLCWRSGDITVDILSGTLAAVMTLAVIYMINSQDPWNTVLLAFLCSSFALVLFKAFGAKQLKIDIMEIEIDGLKSDVKQLMEKIEKLSETPKE